MEKTDNEIIADFIGVEHKPDPFVKSKDLYWHYNEINLMSEALLFDTSWDWLMPACRKWDNLNYDGVPKGGKGEFKSLCDALDNLVSMYEIKPVFKQLCINIRWYNKWYNQQPKKD